MRKATPLLGLVLLPALLGACGDDGGNDEEAFCEAAEIIEDSDPSPDEIIELLEGAPDSISDDADVMIEVLELEEEEGEEAIGELDDEQLDEFEDAAGNVEDFLNDECGIDTTDDDEDEDADEPQGEGDEGAFCDAAADLEGVAEPSVEQLEALLADAPAEIAQDLDLVLEFVEAAEEDPAGAQEDFDLEDIEEAATNVTDFVEAECGIDIDTTDDDIDTGDDGGDDQPAGDLPEAAPAPELEDAEEAALAADCEDGDLAACDELFAITPIGSVGEAYGSTCGGRLGDAEAQEGNCVAFFEGVPDDGTDTGSGTDIELGDPTPAPESGDATLDALAADCEDGDFAACDTLFQETPVGSEQEAYGATCGGRVEESAAQNTFSQCEALFG